MRLFHILDLVASTFAALLLGTAIVVSRRFLHACYGRNPAATASLGSLRSAER
jgi:hypothetical protein